MWKCHCGQENEDFSKFCPVCGSRMNSIGETVADSAEKSDDPLYNDSDVKSEKTDDSSVLIVRSAATWTCSCGEVNPGKSGICRSCGKNSFDMDNSLSFPVFEPPKEEPEYEPTTEEPAPVFEPSYTPPVAPAPVSGWICECGTLNTEASNFCSACGRPNPSLSTATPAVAPIGESYVAPVSVPVAPVSVPVAPVPAPVAPVPAPVVKKEPEIKLPVTTSPGFEGKEITEYIDVVCGSDMYTTGGLANCLQYSYSFEQAKKDLMKKAHGLGADAVISLQTTVFSPQDTFIIVSVSGTAVKFEKDSSEEE